MVAREELLLNAQMAARSGRAQARVGGSDPWRIEGEVYVYACCMCVRCVQRCVCVHCVRRCVCVCVRCVWRCVCCVCVCVYVVRGGVCVYVVYVAGIVCVCCVGQEWRQLFQTGTAITPVVVKIVK